MKRYLFISLLFIGTLFAAPQQGINNGYLQSDLDGRNFKVINLGPPLNSTDAANKDYVDTHGGGGAGGGTGVASLTLAVPSALFVTPVLFDVSSPDITGTLNLQTQNSNSFFGNPSGVVNTPIFMSQSQARTSLNINNVNNTSDLNKPVSTATAAAILADLAAFTGSTNLVTLGTIATGVWNGTAITSAYLPTLNAIAAPVADVSLATHKITNLATPSSGSDATTKDYVDSVATAGPPHEAVVAASTGNLTLSGEQTIDGVLTVTNRVLVKNQSTATENGIYVTAAGAWARATDADTGAEVSGLVFVLPGGTANGGTQWGVATPQPITLGSTNILYAQTASGGSTYTAGPGLTLVGTQFQALGTGGRITIAGGTIDIAAGYIGQNTITNLGTVAVGTWAATPVTGQYGGTGIANTGKTLTLSSSATVGGTNTGDVTLSGENYISLSGQAITAAAVNLSGTNVTGTLAAARFPALTGAVSNSAGSLSTSLASNAVVTGSITNSAVTYAKMQNVTASRLLGNSGLSSAAPAEIPLGAGLAFSGGNLTNTFTGTVANFSAGTLLNGAGPSTIFTTSVANSTTTPALSFALSTAPAHTFLGNNTGITGLPSYSTIAEADVANLVTDLAGKVNNPGEGTVTGGSTGSPTAWPTGKVFVRESPNLTVDHFSTLPLASSFPAGTVISYMDDVTSINVGRYFTGISSDTLNGLATAVGSALPSTWQRFFIAGTTGAYDSKIVHFETNGATAWRTLGTATGVDHVESPNDASVSFTFDPSLQTPGNPGIVIAANGTSYTFNSTDPNQRGVMVDATSSGSFTKAVQHPTSIEPVTYDIGTAGQGINGSARTVDPADGTVDTVQVLGTMVGSLQLTFPPAVLYPAGTTITLLDVSNSVSVSKPITIVANPITSDTFNGVNTPAIFDEAGGRKLFTSDGIANWSVTITKTIVKPFLPIQCTGGTCTITADPNGGKQNAHLFLVSGPNNLVINGPIDGMPVELVLVQPSTGDATLVLPTGSRTPNAGGAGVVTLTAANGAIDRLKGSYDGVLSAFLWDAPILNQKSAAIPSTPTGLSAGSPTSNSITLSWTDASTTEDRFLVYRNTVDSGFTNPIATVPTTTSTGTGTTYTYVDSNLSSLTQYFYRVRAENTGGQSPATASVNSTTSSGAPTGDLLEWHFNDGSGTSVTATPPGPSGTMSIASWALVTGSNYAFPIVAGMNSAAPVTATPNGPASSAVSYTYRVSAWDSGSVTHNLQAVAAAITNVATLNGTNSNTITWTAVPGADHYDIYCTSATGSTRPTGPITGRVGTVLSGTTTFTDTGLATTGGNIGTGVTTNVYTTTATSPVTYGNQVSVSFWVKSPFTPTANANIITTGTSDLIISAMTTGRLQVAMVGSTGTLTGYVATTTGSLNDNNWHNVVVVVDNSQGTNSPAGAAPLTTTPSSTDTLRIWIDGTARAVTYTLVSRSGAATFPPGNPKLGSQTFVGSIDDVRFYNRFLTTTPTNEISALFSGGQQ
jgi:Concanavalin A-like lectin/glucanases superfamily/Fibronectin type III domain